MMFARLVHVMDHQRKELMIIYGEDLAPMGLSVAQIRNRVPGYERWPAIESRLVERAERGVVVAH
jgi:hypothetical protein